MAAVATAPATAPRATVRVSPMGATVPTLRRYGARWWLVAGEDDDGPGVDRAAGGVPLGQHRAARGVDHPTGRRPAGHHPAGHDRHHHDPDRAADDDHR